MVYAFTINNETNEMRFHEASNLYCIETFENWFSFFIVFLCRQNLLRYNHHRRKEVSSRVFKYMPWVLYSLNNKQLQQFLHRIWISWSAYRLLYAVVLWLCYYGILFFFISIILIISKSSKKQQESCMCSRKNSKNSNHVFQ